MNAWEPGLTRDFWWHPYDRTLGEAVRNSARILYGRGEVRAKALRDGARPLLKVGRRTIRRGLVDRIAAWPTSRKARSRRSSWSGCAASTATGRRSRTSPWRPRRATRWSSSAPTGRARRRCCGSSRRSCGRPAARSACSAASSPSEAWKLRGKIGYLGHEPLLYRDLTGRENLRFHAKMYGITGARADERIEELLDTVKLSHRGDERTYEFSAGMRQRLAICRCVLHEPELLLVDEPDSNLDIEGREIAKTLIGPDAGHTRVVVTHDPERFLPEADQVLRLDVNEPAAISR